MACQEVHLALNTTFIFQDPYTKRIEFFWLYKSQALAPCTVPTGEELATEMHDASLGVNDRFAIMNVELRHTSRAHIPP